MQEQCSHPYVLRHVRDPRGQLIIYVTANQIVSLIYEAVRTWMVGVRGKSHLGVSFFTRGQCVLRKWVVEGDGLYEFFGEQ